MVMEDGKGSSSTGSLATLYVVQLACWGIGFLALIVWLVLGLFSVGSRVGKHEYERNMRSSQSSPRVQNQHYRR